MDEGLLPGSARPKASWAGHQHSPFGRREWSDGSGFRSPWRLRSRIALGKSGKTCEIIVLAGPRGGYAIDPKVPRYLLIGDATALPAIASITEVLPAMAEADVVVEVADSLGEQPLASAARLRVHWLHSGTEAPGTTGRIELAVQARSFETDNCRIWLAGESFMVRAVLTHLLIDRGISPGAICAKGYWKLGTAGHQREISSAEG